MHILLNQDLFNVSHAINKKYLEGATVVYRPTLIIPTSFSLSPYFGEEFGRKVIHSQSNQLFEHLENWQGLGGELIRELRLVIASQMTL